MGSRILDLRTTPPPGRVRTGVCIIGTGPAGLALARTLASRGIPALLVDRGPGTPVAPEPADVAGFDRSHYGGATSGRAFGLGGSSSLWGGQLLPILPTDMVARPHAGFPRWPVSHKSLEPYLALAQTWAGVDASPFGLEFARAAGHPSAALQWGAFAPRFSKWIPFSRRNLGRAWLDTILAGQSVRLWLNARVESFGVRPSGSDTTVGEVIVRGPDGHSAAIEADRVVIAAGAIESTHLCLSALESAPDGKPAGWSTGSHFHDHLSLRLGRVEIRDRAAFERLFSPFFRNGIMRSMRLELSAAAAAAHGVPSLYVHFVTVPREESGFAAIRDYLRALQRRDWHTAARAGLGALAATPEVAGLLWSRFALRRLPVERGASVYFHADFEQPAEAGNRLYLGQGTGPGRLRIDWSPPGNVVKVADAAIGTLRGFWTDNGLDDVATLHPAPVEDPGGVLANLYDIYHPAGSTRMACDAADGAVDASLRLFGMRNVYVLSTATFPSMGAANPTLTLMALAIRLGEHLAGEASDRSAPGALSDAGR